MTTETTQPTTIFPDVPRESPVVDKQGNFTELWSLGLGQLFQALQQNFSNEGIAIPKLTAAQMATIQAVYAPYIGHPLPQNDPSVGTQVFIPDISGQTVYDTDTQFTNQFVIAYDNSSPKNIIVAQWVPFAVQISASGNPNYVAGPPVVPAVPGILNWLYFDTSGIALYVCTTSGNTGTIPVSSPISPAVWTPI
jgi:hypothetical protein